MFVLTFAREVEAALLPTLDLLDQVRPRAPASPRPSVGRVLGLRLSAEIVMRWVSSRLQSSGQYSLSYHVLRLWIVRSKR